MKARNNGYINARAILEGTIGDLLEKYPDLVHITSDGYDYVDRCRERRFDVGIAESNLINIASGFALKNYRAIVNGITSFVLYNAFLQVRNNISYHNLAVIIIGFGSGFSYGHLGSTHYTLEDIACLYTLPNIDIYLPADGIEAASMLRQAVKNNRPAYIRARAGREPIVSVLGEYQAISDFDEPVVVDGGFDVLIICYGATVIEGLCAAKTLNRQGYFVSVMCLRTLSERSIDVAICYLKGYKHVVVVEEHYYETGVGSIIHSKWGVLITVMGIKKKTEHQGGTPSEMFVRHGIDSDSIIRKIRDFSV